MDLNYFIDKLSQIDEAKWGISGDDHKKDIMDIVGGFKSPEGEKLWQLVFDKTGGRLTLLWVNDGFDVNYNQKTPKGRILAFLNDLNNQPEEIAPF